MRLPTVIIALKGEKVLFKRNTFFILGEVVKVNEGSVIVKISESDAVKLKIDTPLTVVAHKNYKIIEEKSL